MSELKVGIIGAGVVGLTTALQLKNEIRNVDVTVIAEKFHRETTSYVAAGIFRNGASFRGQNDNETFEWLRNSYDYWNRLENNPQGGSKAGVKQISGYIFSSRHESLVRNAFLEKILPVYREATKEELNSSAGNWKFGSFFSTILTECNLFLPWATHQIEISGGKFLNQKVNRFFDLNSQYDILINCTGLGAKYLCNDDRLVLLRGQVWKVKAPFLKNFYYADYDTYVIPGFEGVTLGGCRQYDSYNTEIDKYDGMAIKERCESLVPSLKNAPVLAQRVGLRPHRDVVRIEKELRVCHGKPMKIVHNYGHGGYGVMTAPGTAIHSVKLVKELWLGNSKI